jgi:hypothetical protein
MAAMLAWSLLDLPMVVLLLAAGARNARRLLAEVEDMGGTALAQEARRCQRQPR